MIAVRTLPELSSRDREILEHVARHRLSVYRVLHERFFSGQGPTAAVKVVSRLCRAGLLKRARIRRREHCIVLTRLAAKMLGHSLRQTSCPGPQSLPIDFAVLMYATAANGRRRLTISELRSVFPWTDRAHTSLPHCLDETQPDSSCLELVRVDLGGKPDHVARKCRADVGKRQDIGGFQDLVRGQRFRLVVITTTQSKADLIRQALDTHLWPDGLMIHLVALPQLSTFLGGKRDAP